MYPPGFAVYITFGVMKLAAILLLVGAIIFGYASSLAPYKDEEAFEQRYMALSAGQNAEYWKLRDEMLTPKFKLQDYGGTLVAAGVLALLISRRGWRNLRSPGSRVRLLMLALAVPFLTVGAYIFDLLRGLEHGEFPHWADSIGIPLMAIPPLLVILLAWAGVHLLFLRRHYRPTVLTQAVSFKANWWLLFVAAVTTALVVLCVAVGKYWFAVPGMGWLYLYLSLAASRRLPQDAEPCGQPDLAHKAAQRRLP